MAKILTTFLAASMFVIVAACNAANQGTTGPRGMIPGAPEPGSPAAQTPQ